MWEDDVLRFLGFCVLAHFLTVLVHGIWARCLRPGKNLKKVYGSWGKLAAIALPPQLSRQ